MAMLKIWGRNTSSNVQKAVWALAEYGFRVVIAPSFSPIFRANCIRNGVARDIVFLEAVEINPVVVHGGSTQTDVVTLTDSSADFSLPSLSGVSVRSVRMLSRISA